MNEVISYSELVSYLDKCGMEDQDLTYVLEALETHAKIVMAAAGVLDTLGADIIAEWELSVDPEDCRLFPDEELAWVGLNAMIGQENPLSPEYIAEG